jgi:UPF0755 protein
LPLTMRSRSALKLAAVLVGLVIVGASVAVHWYRGATRPVAESGQAVLVEIERGSGASTIARQLEERGLIRSAAAFEILLSLSGQAGSLRAGHYELSPTMDAAKIAQTLASGEVAVRRVTVPEGLRLSEIAECVAEAGLGSEEEFLEAAVPENLAGQAEVELPEDSLEGYLFPETYDFEVGTSAADMAARMLRELYDQFVKPYEQQIADSKLSLHEIITLASLVEREAKVPDERELIAGVLMNRLDGGMLLQCDASVQYALGEHKPRLTYDDLKVESPYNTYLHEGLPPGPIAAPGLDSLRAALSPTQTEFLYYVAKPDGGHVFSKTYDEHLAAIAQVRSQ